MPCQKARQNRAYSDLRIKRPSTSIIHMVVMPVNPGAFTADGSFGVPILELWAGALLASTADPVAAGMGFGVPLASGNTDELVLVSVVVFFIA